MRKKDVLVPQLLIIGVSSSLLFLYLCLLVLDGLLEHDYCFHRALKIGAHESDVQADLALSFEAYLRVGVAHPVDETQRGFEVVQGRRHLLLLRGSCVLRLRLLGMLKPAAA